MADRLDTDLADPTRRNDGCGPLATAAAQGRDPQRRPEIALLDHGRVRTLAAAVIVALFASSSAMAATFWPEEGIALTAEELRDAEVVGDRLVIDDMRFFRDDALVAGFSAKPWPGGRLVYRAASTATERKFLAACRWWQAVSKVRCVRRTNQRGGYINVRSVRGTTSSADVGYPGARRVAQMELATNNRGIIAHEIGHALGLSHEHMRTGRDQYVRIIWDNIKPRGKGQFRKKRTANIGVYDFRSIMHYPGYAGQRRRGLRTIEILPPNQAMQRVIGQRKALSELDKAGMAAHYASVP